MKGQESIKGKIRTGILLISVASAALGLTACDKQSSQSEAINLKPTGGFTTNDLRKFEALLKTMPITRSNPEIVSVPDENKNSTLSDK